MINKRNFLKSLSLFGLATLLPGSNFSVFAEPKNQSTINGIPVDILSVELSLRRSTKDVKSQISSFKIVVNDILEADIKVKGKVYHNIGDKLRIKHIYSTSNCPVTMEVSGIVSKISFSNGETYLHLTDGFGRMSIPEVQYINA